jgi:hypothetical protein
MRAAWAIGGVVAVAVIGGCVLVTGGTNGYTAPDGGASSSGGGCSTSKDCNAQACCYAVDDAGVPSAATCQASCPAWQQSCGVGEDCGDGGECLAQSCTFDGVTVQVTTCGAISFCTQ